ncbi:MAG: hypothetical protein AAGK00_00880 [Pseudomonadota bacterium]
MNLFDVAKAVQELQLAYQGAYVEVQQQVFILQESFGVKLGQYVDHPMNPPVELEMAVDRARTGDWLLIRAGEVTRLTLTGLEDWVFEDVTLTLENRLTRMAATPTTAPLVFDKPDNSDLSYGAARFDPPRYIQRVLMQSSTFSTAVIASDAPYQPMYPFNVGEVRDFPVSAKVSELGIQTWGDPGSNLELAIVQENAPTGLSVSTADDRLLHRAPQILAYQQSAVTPDLSDTFNPAAEEGDKITLNLMSQADCVVFFKLDYGRRRVVSGFTPELPKEVVLSPWEPTWLYPLNAEDDDIQRTHFQAKLRATGPVRLGLAEDLGDGPSSIVADPRLRLVQPFQPMATAEAQPMTLPGVWLGLMEPPEAETRLTVELTTWDPKARQVGEPLATKAATLPPGLSNYEVGPGGLSMAWIPFETPLVRDPKDQTLVHALVLSEIDGPARLVELARRKAQLSAALYRDAARSDRLSPRRFGTAEKVLMFDVGWDTPEAPIQFGMRGVRRTLLATSAETDIDISGRTATIRFDAKAAAILTDISAVTRTRPQS